MSLPLGIRNRLVARKNTKCDIKRIEKLWNLLREQNYPLPGENFSFFIYVGGAITPSKHFPDMEANRLRLYQSASDLFEMGYMVYCPSVKWFKDPKKRNKKYFWILEMDFRMIKDRVDGVFACEGSQHSFGFRGEHRLAKAIGKPVVYQSAEDKAALMRNFERYRKKKKMPTPRLRLVASAGRRIAAA